MPHRARHLVTFTTTVLFLICASSARAQCTDDDNDGWTTCNGDCDDTNAAISPADKEKCDGVDNDCDGDIDEGFDVDGNGIGDCLEACPMLLDFDSDPDGLPIYAGADLTEAYADWGIHVDVYYPNGVDPSLGIAFDSSDPSGGDFDLGTPNEDFGGPGIGDGGGLGEAGENALDLFNLLIVAENTTDADGDGLVDTPDDNAVGGWFEFTFDGETCVESLDLVDIEASEAPTDILLYDASGALITTVAAGGLGGNSVEQVTVQECGVRDMVIHFSGSGGVDNIALCVGAVLEICDGIDNDGDGMVDEGYDDDHDGWTTCEGDCNDNDASINPDAAEQCNFVDDDCDGLLMADEVDVDGDGVMACAGDCDDHDADVFPGAVEICNGLDDDCGGDIDEGFDADGDGVTVCGGDCDDGDGSVFPGAPELCDGVDGDCDGALAADEVDADGDGAMVCDGDCDDADPSVYPGATDICDNVDNDCDGIIPASEVDGDGDGYAECEGDCNDFDADVNPGAAEQCNGADDDCDGAVPADEADGDGDGVMVCDGDCDDDDASVYPGAPELCDGLDGDCDGSPAVDEVDADGDGVMVCEGDCDDADATTYPGAVDLCDQADNDCDGIIPATEVDDDGDGYAECAGDCNDFDADVNPDAAEACNGVDDDCDGELPFDEADADGDGHAPCDGDCDDLDGDVNPDAAEQCNGIDDDCDGLLPSEESDLDDDGVSLCDGDCDDEDDLVGMLLYEDDLSVDDGYLATTPQLPDTWAWDGTSTYPIDGGQQVLLGDAEAWTDVVVFADLTSLGSEPGCVEDCEDVCEPYEPEECYTDWQALALGILDAQTTGNGIVTFSNTGAHDICFDGYLVWDNPSSQGVSIGEELLDDQTYRVPAGGSLDVYYGSWTTANGVFEAYYGEAPFWCFQSGTALQVGDVYTTNGSLLPEDLREFIANATDTDGDGIEDHVDWANNYGVQTQHNIWEYQGNHAALTVGKLAQSTASATVQVTLSVQNRGALYGEGLVEDTVPEAWSLVSCDVTPDAVTVELDDSTTLAWDVALNGCTNDCAVFDELVITCELSYDLDADLPVLELPEATVDYFDGDDDETAWSMPAAAFDYDHDGDGVVACGEADRWRAGVLVRAAEDADQSEGYHGYRCALARDAVQDCGADGHYLQIGEFMDGAEGPVDAQTVESCNDPSFEELARTDHDGTLDLDAQDEASLAFWAVGEELMCEADGNGAVIRAEATDSSVTAGTTGLSTFDMFGEFEHIRVCEAFGIPGL